MANVLDCDIEVSEFELHCRRYVFFWTNSFGKVMKLLGITHLSPYNELVHLPYIAGQTLLGATTLGQSGPGNDGNKGVLRIPQISSITGTSSSDCFVSYPGHSRRWGSYLSATVQSVYSTAPAGWAKYIWRWRAASYNGRQYYRWTTSLFCIH